MKRTFYILVTSLCTVSCTTSNSALIGGANVVKTVNTPELTIFLLERDIPQKMNPLGTVAIPIMISTFTFKQVDANVKEKLKELCKEAGANGAYRINDGSYSPYVISYLIFKYDK